jgi:hypothetical protein
MKVGILLSLGLLAAGVDAARKWTINGQCRNDEQTIETCKGNGEIHPRSHPKWCGIRDLKAAKKFEGCQAGIVPGQKPPAKITYAGRCKTEALTKKACVSFKNAKLWDTNRATAFCDLKESRADAESFEYWCKKLANPPRPAPRPAPRPSKPPGSKSCTITASSLVYRKCGKKSKCPQLGQLARGSSVNFKCWEKGDSEEGNKYDFCHFLFCLGYPLHWLTIGSFSFSNWGKDTKGRVFSLAHIKKPCSGESVLLLLQKDKSS